jgi:hypothetical protein
MVDRSRQMQNASAFHRMTPLPAFGRGPSAPNGAAPARLVIPPRLIIPPLASVKRSLWVFRTRKLELPRD